MENVTVTISKDSEAALMAMVGRQLAKADVDPQEGESQFAAALRRCLEDISAPKPVTPTPTAPHVAPVAPGRR